MKTLNLLLTFVLLIGSLTLFAENRIIFYHGNYGLINETLELNLKSGTNTFSYDNIPSGIIDNTIILLPARPNTFSVQSQGYIQERRGFANILRNHIDKNIEIVTKDGSFISGRLFYYDNEVLAVDEKNSNNSIFIRIAEVRNYILKSEDFQHERAPKLDWILTADRAGNYQAQLSYLTTGLSWTGLYKAVWDNEYLQLDVLAKITNNTGVDYQKFNIGLIAGDPKRVSQPQINYGRGYSAFDADMMMAESAPASPQFTAEALDEYHMYTYSVPVDLRHSEAKQIRLFPAKRIKPEVYYEYVTNTKSLQTKLKIVNDEDSGLGFVLPRGSVQIYRQTGNIANLTFVGEDNVAQKPVNEEWIISPGISSDLVGETELIATRRPARNVTENDMRVKLRNRSNETKKVVVIHYIRGTWIIQRESLPHEKIDATRMEFHKELRPNEEYEITWTERIEY
ncbi:MAG: hypothetical protein K0B81_05405 [Candidatus Cloacimonetes bacterium]|nr:hypothetical protein [Candidatus Cloacimonadota bacterium]